MTLVELTTIITIIITMTYTSSTNKVYTETINIDVTDNATEDAGSVAIASERAHIGRSAIQLSQNDSPTTRF